MISGDAIRGYTDLMILSLLLDEPSYGYEISRQIHNITAGQYEMKETTLYSAFNRLESNGYLRSFFGTQSAGKRRTYYEVTAAGREYYQEKINEWKQTKEVVDRFIR